MNPPRYIRPIVLGASVVGVTHRREKLPCQDAFRHTVLSSGDAIVVVADGAGSAAKAGQGSALIVEHLTARLETALMAERPASPGQWRVLMRDAFAQARGVLEEHAATTGSRFEDYAAAVIAAVLGADWTVAALIGDCGIVVLDQADELISMCPPQRGEYVNMTNFLTSNSALERLDTCVLCERVQAAAILTDGLLDLALDSATNVPSSGFFLPLFAFTRGIDDEGLALRQLRRFLDSNSVNRHTGDDKTVVLVHSAPHEDGAESNSEAVPDERLD